VEGEVISTPAGRGVSVGNGVALAAPSAVGAGALVLVGCTGAAVAAVVGAAALAVAVAAGIVLTAVLSGDEEFEFTFGNTTWCVTAAVGVDSIVGVFLAEQAVMRNNDTATNAKRWRYKLINSSVPYIKPG
jgi:hypothetical protein